MTIRQLQCLETIGNGISVDSALQLSQITFGSLCARKWITYDNEHKKFVPTNRGREARSLNTNIDLYRKHNTGVFSKKVHFNARRVLQMSKSA